jgi:hypothetical protein
VIGEADAGENMARVTISYQTQTIQPSSLHKGDDNP